MILIELFKAFSFRSDRRSTLEGTFRNQWLNLAVAWEIVLLTLVINVPFLESAFDTTDLSLGRSALIVGAALTIVPVLEFGKLLVRRSSAGTPPRRSVISPLADRDDPDAPRSRGGYQRQYEGEYPRGASPSARLRPGFARPARPAETFGNTSRRRTCAERSLS